MQPRVSTPHLIVLRLKRVPSPSHVPWTKHWGLVALVALGGSPHIGSVNPRVEEPGKAPSLLPEVNLLLLPTALRGVGALSRPPLSPRQEHRRERVRGMAQDQMAASLGLWWVLIVMAPTSSLSCLIHQVLRGSEIEAKRKKLVIWETNGQRRLCSLGRLPSSCHHSLAHPKPPLHPHTSPQVQSPPHETDF